MELPDTLSGWFDALGGLDLFRALALLLVGIVVSRTLRRVLSAVLEDRLDRHETTLIVRLASWVVLGIFSVTALHQLGFDLSLLLGAAGVFTVAVGFASQTSGSNLVSGLFLLAERPFSIGDAVRIAGTTGEVLSIDLLSVKIRTYDNLFVRVPNETVIKSEVTNMTRFAIRRFDLPIGVAYKEDLEHVRAVLERLADDDPLCLEEPRPIVMVFGFGDSAVNLQFSVWTLRENFLAFRTSIVTGVLREFAAEGIEIPFPHRSLYAGEATAPLPIRMVPEAVDPSTESVPGTSS